MDRTSATGFVLNAAGNRVRVGKNLSTGTPGTELDPTYDNNLQEELVGGIIQWAGLTPDATSTTQIQMALLKMFALGGTTAERPAEPYLYQIYFDTTLGFPVWWTGAKWVNASGAQS